MTVNSPSVLVSHELNVYAESLVSTLAAARPSLDVHRVAPAELDSAIVAQTGAIVVSSRLSPAIEAHAGGWLLYYPEHANVAIVGVDSGSRRIENPAFQDILAALDCLIARFIQRISGKLTRDDGCPPIGPVKPVVPPV